MTKKQRKELNAVRNNQLTSAMKEISNLESELRCVYQNAENAHLYLKHEIVEWWRAARRKVRMLWLGIMRSET